MEELSLQMLRDSGLTLDWQTVCVGWRGFFENSYSNIRLPSEEVIEFAYESLASAADSQVQEALVSIIDAGTNSGFWEVMGRSGDFLAMQSGIAKGLAARKWRYATIYHCVGAFWRERNTYEPDEYYNYPFASTFRLMVSEWNHLIAANPIADPEPVSSSKEAYLLCLEKLRSWLIEEKQHLAEMWQAAERLAPLD